MIFYRTLMLPLTERVNLMYMLKDETNASWVQLRKYLRFKKA